MPVNFETNAKEFSADLDRIAADLGIETEMVIRKITLDVWGRLIELTPVDTGRARASWRITDTGEPGTGEPPGTYSQPTPPVLSFDGVSVLYIVNGLPYIARLNDGWSKQAPAGFVEMAVAEALAQVDVELERLLMQREG